MKLFSIHDSKAETYSPPLAHRTAGEAMRSFETTIKGGDTILSKSPSDFTLCELAAWNMETGGIEPYEKPKILANGTDYVQN